jgi:hypothetical protein
MVRRAPWKCLSRHAGPPQRKRLCRREGSRTLTSLPGHTSLNRAWLPVTPPAHGARPTALARDGLKVRGLLAQLVNGPSKDLTGHRAVPRADNGIRTRGIHLGKVALCLLSYIRIVWELPVRPVGRQGDLRVMTWPGGVAVIPIERLTGLEPATSTLARLRATNCAITA